MAGGHVGAAIELAVNDGLGDGRSRRRGIAEQNAAAVRAEDRGEMRSEFLGEEARVVADDQRGDFFFRNNLAGNHSGR